MADVNLCCVRMCCSDNDEPTDEINETVEYGSYYSSIRNEEIYQDLCAVGRRPEQAQVMSLQPKAFLQEIFQHFLPSI